MSSIKFIRYYAKYFISSTIHYKPLWFSTPFITLELDTRTEGFSQDIPPGSRRVNIPTQVLLSHAQELSLNLYTCRCINPVLKCVLRAKRKFGMTAGVVFNAFDFLLALMKTVTHREPLQVFWKEHRNTCSNHLCKGEARELVAQSLLVEFQPLL